MDRRGYSFLRHMAKTSFYYEHLTIFLRTRFFLLLLLLLSLDAHNHVDDYSGTLGGVRKVHISALVTSPKNLIVALSFSLSLSVKKHTHKNNN